MLANLCHIFSNADVCDGKAQCSDGSDERNCSNCTDNRSFSCNCNRNGLTCPDGNPPCVNESSKFLTRVWRLVKIQKYFQSISIRAFI